MRQETIAAFKVGVFGIVLIVMCSLMLGLLSQLISLDSLVYFAVMAGVMIPMIMVMAGALAVWAAENPGLLVEVPGGDTAQTIILSSVAGAITLGGSIVLFLLAIVAGLYSIFPTGGQLAYFSNAGGYDYLEMAVLLAAYVALSAIGGMLYSIIAPAEKHFVYK